jgi:hypothetical protein
MWCCLSLEPRPPGAVSFDAVASPAWSDRNLQILRRRSGPRNRIPILAHAPKMHFDCSCHQGLRFGKVIACGNAAGKVWSVATVASARLLIDHNVFHVSSPACFRILFSVPGAASFEGCPAMVTRPGFDGCLNCRWLPSCDTSRHPSLSTNFRMSRYFTTEYKSGGSAIFPSRRVFQSCYHRIYPKK